MLDSNHWVNPSRYDRLPRPNQQGCFSVLERVG